MPLRNKNIQVIGLTGLAGHGKTEAADIIEECTGFRRIAFADAVKRAASAMYAINIEYFYEGDHTIDRNATLVTPYNLTIRQIMRIVGDSMKTAQGGDFWINLVKAQIELLSDEDEVRGLIIEDVRYDDTNPWGKLGDEASAVRSWGGVICHVDAMARVGRNDVHNSHSSEKGVKRLDGDTIIDNNGSPEALKTRIRNICESNGWYAL